MSAEEQDAAILRIVKNRAEARRERSLLESDLHAAAEALISFATPLKHISPYNANAFRNILAAGEKAESLLAPAVLEKLRHYVELDRRVTEYNETAKHLGID